MQHPTAHHPITTDTLSWQEQLLIRLDEVVGLLDSIESRLARWEEGTEGIRCQISECQGGHIPDTRHTDTPNLPSVACHLPSVACHLLPAACSLPSDFQRPSPNAEESPL